MRNDDKQASAKRGRYCEKAAGLEKHGNIVILFSLSRAGSMQTRYGPAVKALLQTNPQLGQCMDAAATKLEKELSAALRVQRRQAGPLQSGSAGQQNIAAEPQRLTSGEEAGQLPATGRSQQPHAPSQRPRRAKPKRTKRRNRAPSSQLPHTDTACPLDSAVQAELQGGPRLPDAQVRTWLLEQARVIRDQVRAFTPGEARVAMHKAYYSAGLCQKGELAEQVAIAVCRQYTQLLLLILGKQC